MANTPRIRFKGFTDDWEQRKFGDVVQRQSDIIVSDENYLCVEYEDVISNQGELNKDLHTKHVSKSGVKFSSEDVLYGKLRPYLHNWLNPDFDGVAVGDWWVLKPISLNKNFLYTLIQTPIYDAIANQSSGTKMPRADWKLVSNTYFDMPLTLLEQEKIAYYFSTLDHLITLHQRKCDETKKLKKFMLQKMFPKNGEKNPEIRFAGFTDDWEQRKLGEMCSIITKQTGFDYSATIKPSLVTTREPDTYSFIQNKDFEGLNINLDTDFYIPVSVAEKYPKIILDRPSLLISISGRIGNIALYTIEEKAFIGGAVGICKLKDVDAGKTAMYELMSLEGQKYFASLIKASSHANITVEDIRNIEVLIPRDKMEIIKLNEFIDNLSKLITLHQRKCDNLKLIKKFMLQNMFPKKG